MSVHEDNIVEKCGARDKWSSTQGNSPSYLSGDGHWQSTSTFGTASAATSDDYKSAVLSTIFCVFIHLLVFFLVSTCLFFNVVLPHCTIPTYIAVLHGQLE